MLAGGSTVPLKQQKSVSVPPFTLKSRTTDLPIPLHQVQMSGQQPQGNYRQAAGAPDVNTSYQTISNQLTDSFVLSQGGGHNINESSSNL